ncbi:hypothetical protein BegalDRAFT_0591 [Beggiatoa alba B18LD]|uniref:Uncharacterized protein n=1 Tax=Beggiatoa alba B18LD TaxID=395493 RepID=I3CD14_9GAMM|nr:hypothetical protein BegalDRAFT_0591 [Beggiatoa alba B18LD]
MDNLKSSLQQATPNYPVFCYVIILFMLDTGSLQMIFLTIISTNLSILIHIIHSTTSKI